MGEYADEMIERMQGFGMRRRQQRRQDHTHEDRRDFAIAMHEQLLDELIDELPGDEDDGG